MWSRLQQLSAIAVGSGAGITFYLYTIASNKDRIVHNSWTSHYKFPINECARWDHNWDLREPIALVKSKKALKDATPEEENIYNQKLEDHKATATRHIILVRHGEYYEIGNNDLNKVLTSVGRTQAKHTGERLQQLGIKWDKIISSTQSRAQETAKIIVSTLGNYHIDNCTLIREGAPVPPEPPVGHWKPELTFFRDNPRIEAGFRRYFHRADPKQKHDSYTLLVCHANVIRYFVCRALQFPPEAWLRISLNHASITWISIFPNGNVCLRSLGDSGHIPSDLLTHKAITKEPLANENNAKNI